MPTLRMLIVAAVLLVACSTGARELAVGDCVDIIGVGGDNASERLVSVDCDAEDPEGLYRVVWIEQAADADPITLAQLVAECPGPSLLPDGDMLAAGDRTVICFEPFG